MMYATPVVYSSSIVTGKMKTLLMFNPMTGIIESFRFAFLGKGSFDFGLLGYSLGVTLVLLTIAVFTFTRVEKSFMDTV